MSGLAVSMRAAFTRYFLPGGFMPHGFCFLWNSALLWLHALSDALIFAAYLSISFTLIYFARHRRDLPYRRMFWFFGAFIISCGLTHALAVWTLWHADYWLSGGVKAITALASIATAALLVRLIPNVNALVPVPSRLQEPNPQLFVRSGRPMLLAYGVALSIAAAMLTVLDATRPPVDAGDTLIVFLVPILFAAYFGGLIPGLAITVLCVLASCYWVLPPVHSWRVEGTANDVKWITLFVGGALISLMSERLHHARAEAQAAEARLAGIIGSAMDGIIAVDDHECLTLFNPAAERIFACSAREALGLPLSRFIPGRITGFAPGYEATGPLASRGELRGVRAGGEEFPLEVSVSQAHTGPGHSATMILRDVTAREQAQAENVRLATAIEQAAEAVMITGLDATIEYVNPAFTKITGYRRAEAVGGSPRLLKSGKHDSRFYAELWSTILTGRVWHGEIQNRRKDGNLYVEEMTVTPVRDSHGAITHFIAIKQDVSERKRAEQEIRELNASLEERVAKRTRELDRAMTNLQGEIAVREMADAALERLYRETELILDSAGDGIFRLGADGRCTFANPAACRLLGYTREELAGQDLHEFARHALPDGTPCKAEECGVRAALKLGVLQHAENQLFYRKGGEAVTVDAIVSPIVENGVIEGAVEILRDVTARRAAEKLKQDFVSVVSHEIRSPLTSIRGALGMLDAGRFAGDADQVRHLIEIAVRNADRLTRLIGDILDSERLESGGAGFARRRALASFLASQAVELMQPMAQAAGVAIEAHPLPLPLFADPDAILQVLTNLLSNAVKFSPAGATVQLRVKRGHEAAVFEVADEGQGIPPDKLESIFERFRPVDASDSRRRGGTGLGLSICRRIVQHHGGRIWAESEVGRGTTLVFTLPLERAEENPAPDSSEETPAPAGEVRLDEQTNPDCR